MTTTPGHDEKHRLTAVQGLAALSLDALSSVAYGPEAILVVLVAAGTAGLHYSLPITGAIIILLAALVVSYRQVIEAFPGGGGAYAVARAHLGTRASLVAAASLIVDYVLNAAVGVSAGVAALTSAFPALYGSRVWLCLAALTLITGLNLWGVAESAKVFTVPTENTVSPAYHPAASVPWPEGGPSPATHAGISSPATTLIALLFRAMLSTAAPRPRRARYTAATAFGRLVTTTSTSPPVTMSATPYRCPAAVAATSMAATRLHRPPSARRPAAVRLDDDLASWGSGR